MESEQTAAKGHSPYCVSGSILKLIAVISMLIDHVTYFLIPEGEIFFWVFDWPVSVYWILRYIGRLAFPIYAFLLTEGFVHTKNRFAYGRNLLLFTVLSEIPWNLVHAGTFFYEEQSVMVTLFLGYLALVLIENKKLTPFVKTVGILLLFFACKLGKTDYGVLGFGTILILYLLREKRFLASLCASCILSSQPYVFFAFVPICLYNGKRGFIRKKIAKYAFYAVYPVHLLILYFIKKAVIGN